ncbi:MAG TPA: hypothetical protein VJ739_02200 [Gemmataceae bacterium]|nr:hypothetical protein [Gemmataceae bacterium]
MNVLDENLPESQRILLRRRRVPFRQIGEELGQKGMKDREIIALLHQLDRPTFFTLDGDFFVRRLCHERYCLVHLDVEEEVAAEFIHRLLRHRALNTRTKRLGLVIRATPTGLTVWRVRQDEKDHLSWH